ncbi:TVP38/TMEM64 family protein [Methylomicrobium lacus]|uniref:TVP38/TMEM64 family protein n=1 Tax=Methylomicrobium lacus TaxID=136992 RepID=UPI00045EA01F|nr:VTT domain-containing protein [Methylomicrobium lacus]
MQFQHTSLNRKLSAFLIFVGLVLLIGHELELYLPELEVWIEGRGVFAPLAFIALFMVLSPACVSVDALCFAAGVLFPIATAELTVVIATFLSAAVIFFLGRDLVRARVTAFIAGHKRFAALDKAISGDNAFKLMLLLRLTPLPFALLSYALSVTEVKFRPYLAATSGILVYNCSLVYFGYATKHLTGLANGAPQTGFVSYAMLVFGLVILIAVLIYVAQTAGHLLKDMNLESSDE